MRPRLTTRFNKTFLETPSSNALPTENGVETPAKKINKGKIRSYIVNPFHSG